MTMKHLLLRRKASRGLTEPGLVKRGAHRRSASEGTLSLSLDSSSSTESSVEDCEGGRVLVSPGSASRADPDAFIEGADAANPDDFIEDDEGEGEGRADPDEYIDHDDCSDHSTAPEPAAGDDATALSACTSTIYLRLDSGRPYHRGPQCCPHTPRPAWRRRDSSVHTRFVDEALGLPSAVTERITRPRVSRDELPLLFYSKEDFRSEWAAFCAAKTEEALFGASCQSVVIGEDPRNPTAAAGSGGTGRKFWRGKGKGDTGEEEEEEEEETAVDTAAEF
ncbi:hypothetical protein ACHAXT_012411 [Thalassiosira profunda]